MTSDWWFLAMIGSAASTAAGALGTAASSALSGLGSLAGTAASGLGTAATGALHGIEAVGQGVGHAATGAYNTLTGGGTGASMGIPASETTASGTGAVLPNAPSASAVPTSNLPPASGGTKIAAETPTPPSMAGQDPVSGILGKISPGSGNAISTVHMPQTPYGAQPRTPLLAAQGPGTTLGELTNLPELGQYGAGAAQQATPTTFQLPASMGGPGSPGYTGATSPPTPSFLSQVGTAGKTDLLNRLGVTNPNMGWGDMLKQGGLSQIAGGPFVGYNPQASFLSNLWGAGKQRLLTQALGPPGGQQQGPEALLRLLLAQGQGPAARTLPVVQNSFGGW
jgi:hypothetical protein